MCASVIFYFYRQDAAKRQTAGGRLVAPIHVKLGVTDGHLGPLGYAKFHLNRCRGWEYGAQNTKISNFGKESLPRGESLDRFLKFEAVFNLFQK